MTIFLFSELLAEPSLASAFDPSVDVLDLQAPANRVTVLREGAKLSFTTAAGTVLLPVSWDQIANPDGTSDIILCSSGRLVIGDTALADTHLADPTAGDQFHGRGGDDSFIGGLGDDIAYGNKGSDYLFGSAGDDTLYGGQSGTGTEVIAGGVGNDLIYGNLGADSLMGDGGDDVLYGGQGDDTFKGGSGNDAIYGNRGADQIYGNQGADFIDGGPGNDRLYGGQGEDFVLGGSGNDAIYGNLDDDILKGETAADSLFGGQGNDWMVGGGGDDLLLGNKGSDTLIGNMGADTFRVAPGSGADVDVITDFEIGIDTLVLRDMIVLTNGVEQEGPNVRVYLNSGDQILFHNQLRADIIDLTFPFTILGGGGGGGGGGGSTGGGSTGGTSGGSTGGTTTPSNTAPTVAAALAVTAGEDDIAFTQDLLEGAGDADGDTLSITTPTITGDAAGMILDGTTLSIDPAAYNSLAAGESAIITYNYQITDGNGGSVDQTATITINGANDAPTVAGALASTASEDDGSYTFDLLAGAGDPDSSDTLSITAPTITGDDAGITRNGSTLSIDPAAYNSLAAGESAVITYAYQITDGQGGSVDQTATITITGANDAPSAPSLDWAAVTGATEDVPIPLNITSALSGGDGNYTLSIVVSGLPAGASLSTGTDNLDGSWTLTAAQLSGLQLILAEHDAGDPTITVTAVATHITDGTTLTTSSSQSVAVAAVADAPLLQVDGVWSGSMAGGAEFQVNTTWEKTQVYPSITTLADGSLVVVWASDGQDGSRDGVFGQRLDHAGIPIGSEFQINTQWLGSQAFPEVTALADGGFVVTWESFNENGVNLGIFGQLFDSSGQAVGDEIPIATDSTQYERYPNVLGLENGGFAVVWTQTGTNNGQVFDAAGNPVGSQFEVGPDVRVGDIPGMASFADGSFIISIGRYSSLYVQKFDATGTSIGTPQLVESASSTSGYSGVATLADGGYIVSWIEQHASSFYTGDLYFQHFDADGNAVSSKIAIATPVEYSYSFITVLADGGFVLTWSAYDIDGSGTGIMAQRFDADNMPVGDPFLVNDHTDSHQRFAQITALDDGGFATVWHSLGQDGDQNGIFGKIYSPSITPDAPVLLGISTSLVDTDGSETLSITIAGVPDGASLSAGIDQGDGSWLLTPAQLDGLSLIPSTGLWGDHDLTITATARETENGSVASTTELVTLSFGPEPNVDPTVSAPVTSTSGEDDAAYSVDLLAGASDGNGDSLSITGLSLTSGDGSGISQSGNSLSVNPAAYTYLAVGESAVAVYSYQITDGLGGSVFQTATITITGANDTPTVTASISAEAVNDEAGFAVNLLSGASDPDSSDSLSITGLSVSGDTVGMSLSGNTVTVDPGAYGSLARGESTVVTYSYAITDGHGGSVDQTAIITIAGANIAPTVGDPVASTASEDDATYSVDLLAVASDAENDTLSITGLSLTSGNGSGISQSGNSLSVNPSAYNFLAVGESAVITYAYQITDGFGGSVNQTATITITGANDAPTVAAMELTTSNTSIIAGSFAGDDVDSDDDAGTLSYQIVNNPAAGILTNNGDGTFTFDPNGEFGHLALGQSETVTFSYQATDSHGAASEIVTASIAVTNSPFQLTFGTPKGLGPLDEGFQVNGTGFANQVSPSSTVLADGRIVVVWQSGGVQSTQANYEIVGRLLSPDGTPLGDDFLISDTIRSKYEPIVTALTGGGFAVTWRNLSNEGNNKDDVYTRIFDPAGQPIGASIPVNSDTAGLQGGATTAAMSDGGFITFWYNSNNGIVDILGQRFDDQGLAVNDPISVFDITGDRARQMVVTQLDDGGYVLTWTPVDGSGRGTNIYGQRFDANDQRVGGVFQIDGHSANNHQNHSVTVLADGNIAVAWESAGGTGDNSWEVYGRILDASGNALTDDFRVNTNILEPQFQPDITALGADGFVVTWTNHYAGGRTFSVHGQRFDLAGNPVGVEFEIFSQTHPYNRQGGHPTVITLPDGGFFVTWETYDRDGHLYGLQGQIFDNSATVLEDHQVLLNIGAGLFIENGTFTLDAVVISDLPGGSSLSSGTDNGDGTWTVAPQDLPNLTLILPAHFGGAIALNVAAHGTEVATGESVTLSQVLDLSVESVADVPHLHVDDGAHGLTQSGEEFRVHTYTNGYEYYPYVAALADGGAVVVWQGDNKFGPHPGIYGQIYDSGGVPQGGEFQINSWLDQEQGFARVAGLADGGFVVAWESYLQDGTGYGIYGQRYDGTGQTLGAEFRINTTTSSSERYPDIEALEDGGFVVVWKSSALFGQKFDADGNAVGGEFSIVSGGIVGIPEVTALTGGGFAINWGFSTNRHVQIYDAAGAPVGSAIKIDPSAITVSYGNITGMPDGGFLAIWVGIDSNSIPALYAQRYGADGQISTPEFKIADQVWNHYPFATALKGGGYVVTWETDAEDGHGSGLAGQIFDDNDMPIGDSFRINSYVEWGQHYPSVAALENGGFLVAWHSDFQDSWTSDGHGVYAQYFSPPIAVDTIVPLGISASLVDTDGSETLSITIAGVPLDAALSAGTRGADGIWTLSPGQLAGLTFTPGTGFVGAVDLLVTATATEGANGVTASSRETIMLIYHTPLSGGNSSPEVSAPVTSVAGEDDAAYSVDLLAGASDAENDTLSITGLSLTSGNGSGISQSGNSLSVNPGAYNSLAVGESAVAVYSYQITDGLGGSVFQTATITITGANDTPTVAASISAETVNDEAGFTVNLLSGASDPDSSDSLSITGLSVSGDTVGMSLSGNTVTVDPGAYGSLARGESVVVTYSYAITDGHGGSVNQTATITIAGANIAPTVGNPITSTASEDDAAYSVDLLAGASDAENDTLSITGLGLTSGNGSGISQSGNSLSVNPSAYNFLAVGESAVITYAYQITDGFGGSVNQTASITILGANDAPTVAGALASTASEDDGIYTFDLLSGAGDPDTNDNLSITGLAVTSDVTGMTLDGSIVSIDPAAYNVLSAGESVVVTYSYQVVDGFGGSVDQTATITITGANDAPTVDGPIQVSAYQNDPVFTIDLRAGTTDPDSNDILRVNELAFTGDASGLADDGPLLTIDPTAYAYLGAGETTEIICNYIVRDGHGGEVNNIATIIVSGDNYTLPVPILSIGSASVFGPIGGEFQINTTELFDQSYPAIAAITGGGFIAIWQSLHHNGSDYDVYGQLFSADGTALGSEFRANTHTFSNQADAQVAALANGGFVVTWSSVYQDGDYEGIYGQIFSADGVALGSEFQINTSAQGRQEYPSISALSDGGFVVTWQSDSSFDLDTSASGIFGQRFSADGTPVNSEIFINTYIDDYQRYPSVAGLSNGGFIVAWSSSGQDGSGYGIFGQRYGIDGSVDGEEFQVNTESYRDQQWPNVSTLVNGGYVITWASYLQDGSNYGIFAQRYDSTGAAIGSEFQVNTTTDYPQTRPSVTSLADGGFVITWTSYGLRNSDGDIFGQRFDAEGKTVGTEFWVNSYYDGYQEYSRVAGLETGGFVVTWQSDGLAGEGKGIFGQIYDIPGIREDIPIALDIAASLDEGASDIRLSILIEGVPVGASLSTGTKRDDGGWILTAAELPGLILSPAANDDSDINLMVTATASDTRIGTTFTTSSTRSQTVSVSAVADTPILGSGQTRNLGSSPIGGEIKINTYPDGQQSSVDIAALSGGGFLATWHSNLQDGSGLGVYGQRIGDDGSPQGGEFQINTGTVKNQFFPSVAQLADGGFFVAWTGEDQYYSYQRILGQRFDSDGNKIGSEVMINIGGHSYPNDADVVALADGGYIVSWRANDSPKVGNIYTGYVLGKRFNANGQQVGEYFQVNTETDGQVSGPKVAVSSDGSFLVTWSFSYNDDENGGDIYHQLFNADGNAIGGNFQVNTFDAGVQYFGRGLPTVAALENGGYVIVWQSWEQDGSGTGVFAQRIDDAGNLVGSEFQVNSSVDGHQEKPAVTALKDGGFVVTWQSPQDTTSFAGIYGQRFNANAVPIGEEFSVTSFSGNTASMPEMVSLADSGFVVAWSSGKPGVDSDIFAQRFSPPLDEDSPVELGLSASLVDTDGSETLSILIAGMPEGASLSTGIDNGDGSWSLAPGELPGLVFTPPEGFAGGITLTVTATATESSNGDTASTSEVLGLVYGAVDDTLTGTTGPDTFTGGGGNDTLTGGSGADTFLYSDISMDGHDVITDFTSGSDVISLDVLFDNLAIATANRAAMVNQAIDLAAGQSVLTVTGYEAGFSITLLGVTESLTTGIAAGADIDLGAL